MYSSTALSRYLKIMYTFNKTSFTIVVFHYPLKCYATVAFNFFINKPFLWKM